MLSYRLTLAKMSDRINEKSRAKEILDSDKTIRNTHIENLESLIYVRPIALGPVHPLKRI